MYLTVKPGVRVGGGAGVDVGGSMGGPLSKSL